MKQDVLCGGIRPETFTKEIKRQLRKGKLTEEQALELLQKYMDSLEYNEVPLPDCGGIQPIILPEEEKECTEQF